MTKKLPTPKARALLAKLEALAERGVNGEKANAQKKLAALKKRYDFTKKNDGGSDIFAGVFIAAPGPAAPIMRFDLADYDIANSVKWAIEKETGVPCLFRGGELCAQATADTANRLHEIAATVAADFAALWGQFKAAPGVNAADRGNFVLGLYEGMMDEARAGQLLPSRPKVEKIKRPKKNAVAPPAGLSVHPYTVAVNLGKQVRFCVPLVEIAGQLDEAVRPQLTEAA